MDANLLISRKMMMKKMKKMTRKKKKRNQHQERGEERKERRDQAEDRPALVLLEVKVSSISQVSMTSKLWTLRKTRSLLFHYLFE